MFPTVPWIRTSSVRLQLHSDLGPKDPYPDYDTIRISDPDNPDRTTNPGTPAYTVVPSDLVQTKYCFNL